MSLKGMNGFHNDQHIVALILTNHVIDNDFGHVIKLREILSSCKMGEMWKIKNKIKK